MTETDTKVTNLFKQCFGDQDFLKRGMSRQFHCPHSVDCGVFPEKEPIPIWTSYPGDEGTEVMIVAEAPSNTGGPGVHIAGRFADTEIDPRSPLHILKQFVKDNYGTIPYFADLVKCGLSKQGDNKPIQNRATNCYEQLLRKEIEIIKPKTILCIGGLAQEFLKKRQSQGDISRDIALVSLMHYSRRASLPLSNEDKMNIIWKKQANKISNSELSKIPLTELSFFKK